MSAGDRTVTDPGRQERPLTQADQAALNSIAGLAASRGRDEALAKLRNLVAPSDTPSLILFSAIRTALHAEAIVDARQWATRLARRDQPDWQSALQVAEVLRGAGMSDEAGRYLGRLVARFPDQPVLHAQLGAQAAARGALDEARDHHRHALALDPGLTAPYLFLSRDPDSAPQPLIDALRGLPRQNLTPAQQANLLIAQGNCLDRLGDHRPAFEAYSNARDLTFSRRAASDLERQIKSAPAFVDDFDAETIRRAAGRGHPGNHPVFVVGMPRSGSTLIAQVLGAHSQVASLGERRILGNIVHDRFRQSAGQQSLVRALSEGDDTLRSLGDRYLQQAGALAPATALRWIDKLPFNFSLTGAAHLIFPAARTLYTRRAPLDTCWSMFTAAFSLDALQLDLAGIGRLHALSEFLMAHWTRAIPGAVVAVDYEKLVSHFEPQARALITQLGLDWEPACLAFHEQRNEVLTASDAQVHRPLFATSLGRSAPYAAWLEPFQEAREATLQRLQAASPAEQMP